MKSKFTNFYIKLSLYLTVFVGLGASSALAQGFAGGRTYVVNGQTDLVAPVDTFVNLMGAGNAGAITYLNANGIDVSQSPGTVTILLSAGYTGVEPSVVQVGNTSGTGYPNMSSTRPVVLKPAAGLNFIITTSATVAPNGSLFRIFGSTDFSIDGSGTPGQRNITFSMGTSAQTSSRVIDIIPAAASRIRNVAVRNCIIVGNSTATANNTYAGIYFGGASATPQNALLGTNLNISYTNNLIMAVQNGIYHRGFPTNVSAFPSQDTGLVINNNIIGSYNNPITPTASATIGGVAANLAGIYLQNVSNSTVSGNVIRNTLPLSVANVNGGFSGIRLDAGGSNVSLDSNIRIVKNQIHSLYSNFSGQGVYGIRISLGGHTSSRKLLIANNSISKIASLNGSSLITAVVQYTAGIMVDNTTTDLGLELLFNSVNLTSDTLAVNSVSSCLAVGPGVTGGIYALNNSFSNTMGRTASNVAGYQVYSVVIAANNANPFTYSNFNNYYANTLGGGYAFVAGVVKNNTITHAATLKNYAQYSITDTNSLSVIPPSTSDTLFFVANGTANRTYNRGYAINTLGQFSPAVFNMISNKIVDDMYGNIRTGLGRFTSIGCHQWVGDSINIPGALYSGKTYLINGVSNPPTAPTAATGSFSFRDLTEAINHLNSFGITGNQNNVTLQIGPGYPRENNYLPAIIDYPGSNSSLNVVITTAPGYVDTIWAPNTLNPANSSVLRFMGARNVIVDGRASGSNNFRNLTFMFRTFSATNNARVIGIVPTDLSSQNITIKNVNILGNTTTTAINTHAGVYYGFPLTNAIPTPNDTLRTVNNVNINILNNLIQGVRNGIMVRGSAANPAGDPAAFEATAVGVPTFRIQNLRIAGNIIGGTVAPGGSLPTTFIGGAADQAGIFVVGVEATQIDSNIIRNCLPTTNVSTGFRGIEVVETSLKYPNWDVSVTKNFIYNLQTISGQSVIGIRTQFGAPAGARGYLFANNSISNLLAPGASTPISVANPTGILIDATQQMTAANAVTLINNTVNMSGNNILIANSGIAALYVGANMRGGIASINNIFGVTANRTTAGNMYSMVILGPVSPFTANPTFSIPASDFNSYFVSGNNPTPTNNILMATPSLAPATRTNINAIRQFMGNNIDLSSFNFATQFISDTLPDLLAVSAGSRYTAGASNSVVLTDIYNVSRAVGSTLGAVNFTLQNAPLQPNGVYQINGVDNYPVFASATSGSFRNLRSAVNYLNAFGTGLSFSGVQPAKLVISAGYVGETDLFTSPITVLDFPSANAAVPVVVTVAAGRQDTIKFTNVPVAPPVNSSLIRITSGQYFGFDGSNNGTTSRDLTIVMPAIMTSNTYKIIDLLGGQSSIFAQSLATSNNFVNNCNLIGNSTVSGINTFAAIYMGGITATPSNSAGLGANNNNSFSNNFIGGCQYGIYLRSNGVRGQGDVSTNIADNIIGGNIAPGGSVATNYFGGIANAAGIFCVGQYRANITGNKIQNNIVTFSNPRGIELGIIAGSNTVLDSANIINGNIIKNITSTNSGSSAYGIYMNFGADAGNVTNSTRISNNMISAISAPGSATLMSGVYGIAIDATATFSDPNIAIHYNSINLGAGNNVTAGRTACLAIAPSFVLNSTSQILQSGFKMNNNLFSNKLGGSTVGAGVRASAVQIGSLLSPFVICDNNNYFVNATNAINNQFVGNANNASPNVYNGWEEINKFTGGDLFSSNFTVPFTSDVDLFIPALTNSVIYGVAAPITGINTDVINTTRSGLNPTLGAHEYTGGNNIDSISPRIIPSNATACLSSLFNTISFVIADRNYTGDVFTYRVNGGASVDLPMSASTSVFNANGSVTKTYIIPTAVLNAGGVIEYKITATDIAGNNGVYPTSSTWQKLPTGIATFPYTMNFENGADGWNAQSLTLGAQWNTAAFGSSTNPSQATENGTKCALFPSSTLPAGASARLTSPCFNLSVLSRPILRFRFSQSNNAPTRRDSIIVRILLNGFNGPDLKVIARPNAQSPFPDWFTYEACLSEYRVPGNTYSFQFDAFSVGAGQNIMIDSIQILDDVQSQVITPLTSTICNTSQPFTVTIPNTDPRYVYRAFQTDINGNYVSTLDTAFGNSSDLTLTFANRQVDSLFYVINAINYGSVLYQPPFSTVSPNICSNNLPGSFTTVINRFNRPFLQIGGYIIPDLAPNAFNGTANDGDQFKPDAVKPGKTLTYEILSPTSYYTTGSYGTNWTILNTSVRTFPGNTPATTSSFVAPTASSNAKVLFTPTAAEGDSMFMITSTIRFLGTNCDTTVYRFVKVANALSYNFVTGPRADTACTGTALNFVINQGPQAGVSWLWDFGDGSNTVQNVVANPAKIWSTPGTYRVRLTATSALGITDTVSKLITVLQAPSAAYNVSSVAIVCQNDSAVFSVANQGSNLSYLWTFPGNVTRTIPVTNFRFSKADTNYAVTLRVTNSANACFALNTRIFPSYAKPKANFTVASHCQGEFLPYTDSSSISNNDRLGYFWSFSTGEQRQSNSFQIKFANSGNVRVSLRLTSAAGCEDTTSRLVTVYETPQPDFLFNSACTNDSTSFTNQTVFGAGIQNVNYVWNFGDNSGTDNRQDPKHRYLNNNSGDPFVVTLTASNKLFGCSATATKNVVVKTAPVAVAELGGTIKTGVNTDRVCQGNLVTFESKSFSPSGAGITCNWVFGNGPSSGSCSSSNIYPDAGTFTWTISATADGCIDSKSGTITVVPKPVITFSKQSFAVPPSRFTVNNRKVLTPSDLASDQNTYFWNYGDADSTVTSQRIPDFTYNKPGTFTVRMQVTTTDGCVVNYQDTVIVNVGVSAGQELASKFSLNTYPNPFTNSTTVSLSLTKSEDVTLTVMDVLGRVISSTTHKNVAVGTNAFELTSNNFNAAGTYFVKIQIGEEVMVKSLVKQ